MKEKLANFVLFIDYEKKNLHRDDYGTPSLSLLFSMYKVLITSHCSANYYESYSTFSVLLNDEKLEFAVIRKFWFCIIDLSRSLVPIVL